MSKKPCSGDAIGLGTPRPAASVTDIWKCIISARMIYHDLDEKGLAIDRKDDLAKTKNHNRQTYVYQYEDALRQVADRTPARDLTDVFAHLLLADNRADNMLASDCTPDQTEEGLEAIRRILRSSLLVMAAHLNLDLAEWSNDPNTADRCAAEFVEGLAV